MKTTETSQMYKGTMKEAKTIAEPRSPCNKIDAAEIPMTKKVRIVVLMSEDKCFVRDNNLATVNAHVNFKNSPDCNVNTPIFSQALCPPTAFAFNNVKKTNANERKNSWYAKR